MFVLLSGLCVLGGVALILFGYILWGVAVVVLGYLGLVGVFLHGVNATHTELQKPVHKGLLPTVEHKEHKEHIEHKESLA